MRLIRTKDLRLEQVLSEDEKHYAILSHRWEAEEVSLQEMQQSYKRFSRQAAKLAHKKGYQKIKQCCAQARMDGYEYVWIDTCCIDKTSSAELSEAINSMYRWYQKAGIAYAFLSDVSFDDRYDYKLPSSFSQSSWWSRGWTLQELLAPKTLIFYDCQWRYINTRQELCGTISDITRIDRSVLDGTSQDDLLGFPVAKRMSWAAGRVTTRIEDRAYSLLGIFDVNMPMLYGEGEKAFIRLQEEIIRRTDDHSIFAWALPCYQNYSGLLAKSPDNFADCSEVELPHSIDRSVSASTFTMTNRGLSISLDLRPWAADTYLALLNCYTQGESSEPEKVGIYLSRCSEDDQYVRVNLGQRSLAFGCESSHRSRFVALYVKQDVRDFKLMPSRDDYIYGFRFCCPNIPDQTDPNNDTRFIIPAQAVQSGFWNRDKQIFWNREIGYWDHEHQIFHMFHGEWGPTLILMLGSLDDSLGTLLLGFDFDHNPILVLLDKSKAATWPYTVPLFHDIKHSEAGVIKDDKHVLAIKGDRRDGIAAKIHRRGEKYGELFLYVERVPYLNWMVWEVSLVGLDHGPNEPMERKAPTLFLPGALSDNSTGDQNPFFPLEGRGLERWVSEEQSNS
ncbi:HET-domain-containing protein [Xylariomycetidae sp. FL0641]|nr:HET-domain-containing protein [Xylariomycetidae sp. FL0641]